MYKRQHRRSGKTAAGGARDDFAPAVGLDVALRLEDDSAGINSVDLLRSRLSSKHGEDTCARSNVNSARDRQDNAAHQFRSQRRGRQRP